MDALKRTQWLASGVLVLTASLLAGLVGRVAWIQKHVTTDTLEKLRKQNTAVIPISAQRAQINFADGTPAAMSVRVFNLFADPAFITDPKGNLNPLKAGDLKKAQEVLVEALAPLVSVPAMDLQFQIQDNVYYKKETAPGVWSPTDKPRRFMWLAREVDEDFYDRFLALKEKLRAESQMLLKTDGRSKDAAVRTAAQEKSAILYHALDGVGFTRSMKRVYPMGSLAASVIGYANRYEGVDGMEHQLDPLLKGIDGSMFVTKDAQRTTLNIQDERFTPADNGNMVWLTLDTVIQGISEQQLKQAVEDHGAVSGTAVVLDPFSGKILALANYPSFDPARFGDTAGDVRRNRAVTDPYEPGSIWKPFVLAWALDKGVVKVTDRYFCPENYYDPAGRLVRDTHAVGEATVAEILIKSSNVGMTQIGWKMGNATMREGVTTFGFGSRTGVELPGDQKGTVKSLAQWNKGTLTSASFGYEVAATPLQLVRAYATFANGGFLVTPRVINAVETSPGKAVSWNQISPAAPAPRIINAHTADTMRDIMKEVLGPKGTAKAAASKMYTMFGKTGTAHIAAGSHGLEGKGYGANDYDSSFLVGGPYVNPKLVAIVTLHKPNLKNGYFGGVVAAPTAVAIMDRSLMYMQVPADIAPATQPAKKVPAR